MTDNYDDIKHLTRPQYDDLHPMSMHDRAAQFSPFAALVGYDDAVAETARLTDSRDELTEDEITDLNTNLNRLLDSLDEQPEISVTYFVPDEKKSGIQRCYVETLTIYAKEKTYVFSAQMDIDYDEVAKDPASMTAQFENSKFSRLKNYIEERIYINI